MTVKYLTKKATGLFMYRRGIPKDLQQFYQGKTEIKSSLKTYNENEACRKAVFLAKRHNLEFEKLRGSCERDLAVQLIKSYGLIDAPLNRQTATNEDGFLDDIGSPYWCLIEDLSNKYDRGDHYAQELPHEKRALDILGDKESVILEEVRAFALRDLQDNKKIRDTKRSFDYFEARLSVTTIKNIRNRDVYEVIEALLAEGLATLTVKKALGVVRKQTGEYLSIYHQEIPNPFAVVKVKNAGKDTIQKHVFEDNELKQIAKAIRGNLEPPALVAGLLFNTGARIAEVGGLKISDINLEGDTPSIKIQESSSRRLKTKDSNRTIPLIGISLEIAKVIIANAKEDQEFAFERYNKDSAYSEANCRQAVNKWLRTVVGQGTSHSFRHSLRDRLLEAGNTEMEINNIFGWNSASMINNYGKSKALKQLQAALDRTYQY